MKHFHFTLCYTIREADPWEKMPDESCHWKQSIASLVCFISEAHSPFSMYNCQGLVNHTVITGGNSCTLLIYDEIFLYFILQSISLIMLLTEIPGFALIDLIMSSLNSEPLINWWIKLHDLCCAYRNLSKYLLSISSCAGTLPCMRVNMQMKDWVCTGLRDSIQDEIATLPKSLPDCAGWDGNTVYGPPWGCTGWDINTIHRNALQCPRWDGNTMHRPAWLCAG